MTGKIDTIKKDEDFKRVLSKGKHYSAKHLKARAIKNSTGKTRVGIIIGRKFGKAVDRNKARRRIKEAFAKVPGSGMAGADIAIFPDITAKTAGFLEIDRGIREIMGRIRLE